MRRPRPFDLLRITTVALLWVIASCGDEEQPTDTTVALPNPASVFCEDAGGTIEIVTEQGGQVGYCTLPDGRRVEEWEYYRSQHEASSGG